MSTQSVLPFPCRKQRVLSPKIMNLENSPTKSTYWITSGRKESRSVMTQPKSPRKWLGEKTNLSERWTQEDLLNEIFRLSPHSPIKPKMDCPSKTPDSRMLPGKKVHDRNSIMSPSRTLLSPIRSLSLQSPQRIEQQTDLKRSKILQLKLEKISVCDPNSPVKVPPGKLNHSEEIYKVAMQKNASQIVEAATPKKIIPAFEKRITRSARKLQCQQKLTDAVIQDDFKENVPPGSCPTPSKKKKPSPEPKKAQATPRSQRTKKRVARKLDVNVRSKGVSPKKLDFKAISTTPTASPQKETKESGKAFLALHKPNSLPYQLTKHALHSSLPDELVGRGHEMKTITDFVTSRIKCNKSGSLYISGAPGTGKSACATKVLSSNEIAKHAQVITINCMSTKNATAIYSKIASELGAKPATCNTVKSSVHFLETSLTSSTHPVVLLLDEMDQLTSKNQEVLYTMFEWPALPNSRLILIGIANALDLTDRILPRLQTRKNCQPDLLNFRPYSKDQLISILEDRLKKITTAEERVIDPMAIQLCARKVSAVAGDARKALDICRCAVEGVETSVKSQAILSSPAKMSGLPGKVGPKQIARVFSEVYESSLVRTKLCGNSTEEESFPLQQKLAICTILLLSRYIKCKVVTVGKLHDAYSKVCKKRKVTAVSQSEFLSMLRLIETRGILSMKAAKQTRMSKVSLSLQEKDVEHALCDKTLLSAILQEGLPKY